MNEFLKAFKDGFVQGARETPRGFFAPVVALCRWLNRVTDEAMSKKGRQDERRRTIHSEPAKGMEASVFDNHADVSMEAWHVPLAHALERITVLEHRQDKLDQAMRSARAAHGPDDSAIENKE
jgi:hypothetical protein